MHGMISGDCLQIPFRGGLHGSRLAPQVMPLELLREITNDFNEEQRVGRGTFGTVYKASNIDHEYCLFSQYSIYKLQQTLLPVGIDMGLLGASRTSNLMHRLSLCSLGL